MRSGKRNNLIDTLRGITIVSMIVYHVMWDLIYMFGRESGMAAHASWYEGWPGYLWQQSICWTFILLSGYCVRFSRNSVRRGLIVLACGTAVSVVTAVFMPEAAVRFGVLTFLGCAMIVAGVVRRFTERNESEWTRPHDSFLFAVICAVLFFLTRNINTHTFGFEGLVLGRVPEGLYRNMVTAFFGFPPAGFFSTDYFSFFPWIFLFGVGVSMSRMVRGEMGKKCVNVPVPLTHGGDKGMGTMAGFQGEFLHALGRHSLLIYMLHQPVLYGIFYLIFRAF